MKSTRKPTKPLSESNGMFDFAVLRGLRQREGWTLSELSTRSGVSPSVISKLERNQTAAELSTLFSLSRVFGMSVTDLLHLAEARTAHRVSESAHKTAAFTFRQVEYGNLRALFGTAAAGARVTNPEVHRDDYELCWVLRGRVGISLPHERHELAAGACIQFDAILEHTYEVIEPCELLILHIRKEKRF
jgi:transcriptional regulator with XRE-family HTH domain